MWRYISSLLKSFYFISSFNLFKKFFVTLFILILFVIISIVLVQLWSWNGEKYVNLKKIDLLNIQNLPEVSLLEDHPISLPTNSQCTHWDCFNIYRCGKTGHNRIMVYIHPLIKYIDKTGMEVMPHMSKQYFLLLKTIANSKYYTPNINEACILIPSIDTLNQERLDLNFTSKALQQLDLWKDGENHLIFNMHSGSAHKFPNGLEINLGKAMRAAADFDVYNFRKGFDISIPVYSPILNLLKLNPNRRKRRYFLTSSQLSIDSYFVDGLHYLQTLNNNLLVLDMCQNHNYSLRCDVLSHEVYLYPQIMEHSTFCLILRGEKIGQLVLLEAMAAGCIPVISSDSTVMPFNTVIDWNRAAIFVMEEAFSTVIEVLKSISNNRIRQMQNHIKFLYKSYFCDINKIVSTTLDIIQDRIYPQFAKNYDDWNLSPEEKSTNPLFLPITIPKSQGFTVVILTYDRVQSLFLLIQKLATVPSAMKVIIVWNNQYKLPPPMSDFPPISKPIKIIKTKANKLSNRFYPYEEIETEGILTIDDDIVMLTSDELQFGYEVWREFPDRIVGFPSRTHIWENTTNSWKYESEWTNEISMVLTGVAFHHKYWSFLYTTELPSEIRDWVDDHMNCEDIAMNFLVANITKKPPIKVAPRKKFKCPECVNNEMLSADLGHMVERTKCINKFSEVFGHMPLKSVEFRADPVLYKDAFPEKLKRFNNIGNL